ncbi:MAG: HAD family phosphatase [Clostridia bacterium]|nr:HAD family phosphatase [Clostridia bacterium]
MGKFDGVLICTDLDGTLFRKDKTVSTENREAIEYFKREGGYFTFVTGRMPNYSMTAYRAVNPNVPFGAVNGGALYDGATGEYVWTTPMTEDPTELIKSIDVVLPAVSIQVCTMNTTYFAKNTDMTERFRQVTGLPNIERSYLEIDEPIAKIIFGTDYEEEMQAVINILAEHPLSQRFDFIRSERKLFEILPKGVHKGRALLKLANYLGVDPKRTVAVGDYYNDVPMLRAAGVGVAVSNACDAAKEAADFITASNEEHAIAHVIRDIESKKISL